MAEKAHLSLVRTLFADILSRIEAICTLSRELTAQEYVSSEAPRLLQAIAEVAEGMKAEASVLVTKYEETRQFSYLNMLRGIDGAVQQLAGDLRLPARATSDRVPGVLARLVARKVATLFSGSGIILRPVWKYQYKVHREDVRSRYNRDLADFFRDDSSLSSALAALPSRLFVISFPLIEREAIHLHSVLGHEIGHLIARTYDDPATAKNSFTKQVEEYRQKHEPSKAIRQLDFSFEDQKPPEILTALAARSRGLTELASDVASVYLLGLPAVFGAANIAMARGLTARSAETSHYPTWGVRLQQMLKVAREDGWLDLQGLADEGALLSGATEKVSDHVKWLEKWVGEDSSSWQSANPYIRLGHLDAQAQLIHVKEFFQDSFKGAFADPETVYSRLPGLVDRLRRKLPPDNLAPSKLIPEPPDLQDVLSAAWWYRLNIGLDFEGDDLTEAHRIESGRLRRLVLKAIENIDTVHRYSRSLSDVFAETEGS